ncbi:phosphate signaling complex protein PhoU [Rhodococcus aetherivorans]|uniref:phosphate signaling complex protein PhoU n=1 Tax=Rhodococcus aetherivorans TaxID=191292 RepID=UPI001E65A788|nr:phosphate signaling complex protein PhoU [Rhodococcus aetherivorans]UGQ42420.1 phosphate signaling complex protein PhoU [Rhodococcus aetherivorans]
MREVFTAKLDDLRVELAELCAMTETAIELATRALLDTDLAAAEDTLDLHAEIDNRARDLDRRALTLLALQAPVAQDLRALVSGMHNIADLRRMGSLAAHIAEVARLHHPNPVVPEELRGLVGEMGAVAERQAAAAKDVLRTRDQDGAVRLIAGDDRADALLVQLFSATRDPQWPHGASAAVNLTLLGRFYERFCDHTVEVGRRIVFVVTGTFPDERPPAPPTEELWLAPPHTAFGT